MHPNQNTLMPDSYFPDRDDIEFIQQMLSVLPINARNKARMEYAIVYQEWWEKELISFRKDNTARHEANTRLREYVGNVHKAIQGYTKEPPKAQNALPGTIPNPGARQTRS